MIIEMFERGGYFQHAKMSLTTLNYHIIVEIYVWGQSLKIFDDEGLRSTSNIKLSHSR
jgi:hypothetical protein